MYQPDLRPPRPHQVRAHRRHEWLAIYLPMLAGLAIAVGLGALLWRAGRVDPSLWADISLIFLLAGCLLAGLLALLLALAMAIGLRYAVRWLPAPSAQGRIYVRRGAEILIQASDWAAKPVIAPQAAWTGVKAGLRSLAAIFRSSGKRAV